MLPGRLEASYAAVNAAVCSAIEALGTGFRVSEPTPGRDRAAASRWCFAAPTGLDLVDTGGAKVVGSAQRRRARRMLHHGSIVLEAPTGQSFCGGVGCDWQDLAEKLEHSMCAALGVTSTRREALTPKIADRARELEMSRYATRDWTFRR